ncbi:MAG: hypothetical protein HZA90_27765 [Verrucomicrobia bacterium]|nr:hypothetical protein [Verrucomicrobiota bacterium]
MKQFVAALSLLLALSPLVPTHGAVMLDVDNGNSGADRFHVNDANPSHSVYFSFANASGSAASFGVLDWSISRSQTAPNADLLWSLSYQGGDQVASGSILQGSIGNGFADHTIDFRTTPGAIASSGITTFIFTLSAPGHAPGSSYDFKYTSSQTLYDVPFPPDPIPNNRTTYTGNISVTVDYTPVPEPVAATGMIAVGVALAAAIFRRRPGRIARKQAASPPS